MFIRDYPNEPFSPGERVSLYGPRPMVAPPRHALEIRVSDGVDARLLRPDLPFEITRLTVSSPGELGSSSADLVVEALLGVPDVLRPEWTVEPKSGVVDVPVARPTIVTDTELTWQVTPALSVHHSDNATVGLLRLSTTPSSPGPSFIDLTRAECTNLTTALASLRYWRLALQDMRDPLLVRGVHRAMRRAWTTRNAFRA